MQGVPSPRFVGVNCRSHRDFRADCRDRFAFLAKHEWKRAAVALAYDHHNLTLACLFLGKPTVNPIGDFVRLLLSAAEICAINFLLCLRRKFSCLLIDLDCFPQFVGEYEGALVRAAKVAALFGAPNGPWLHS